MGLAQPVAVAPVAVQVSVRAAFVVSVAVAV